MINNCSALILLAIWGCESVKADEPEPLQGVVELGERTLAFEVGGRLLEVLVNEAEQVEQGAVVCSHRSHPGNDRGETPARRSCVPLKRS